MNDEKTYTGDELLAHLEELDKESDMAKNKKDPGPTDKVYSLFDLEQMAEARWMDERRRGMYKCHDAFSDSVARLRQSLEDVWAIEYTGPITPYKEARVAELGFAINTLIALEDMFQAEYDTQIDKLNTNAEEDYEFRNPS